MKALVVSDLHFEFHEDDGRAMVESLAPADLIVIAGDLSPCEWLIYSLSMFCHRFPKVLFVAGNHEFYGSSFEDVRAALRHAVAIHENLYVLDNSVEEIGGIRFVGTTMWTRKTEHSHLYHSNIADFGVIRDGAAQIYAENDLALAFLDKEVREGDVVVTHHLPADESIHWRYKRSVINQFFLCDVRPLIEERKPRIWIHGHTHETCDYNVGPTRVLCNPYGYVGRDTNKYFKRGLVVDL